MGYMAVEVNNESFLKLVRGPSMQSKAVLSGILVGVLGVIMLGSESFLSKSLIGLTAVVASWFVVENYEVCEIDKKTGEARLSSLQWGKYILGQLLSKDLEPYITVKLEDVKSAQVEHQGEGDSEARQVALCMHNGVHLGITEVFTTDDVQEHEFLASLISTFLNSSADDIICEDKNVDEPISENDSDSQNETDADDEDDEDFEQISKEDVQGYQEEEQDEEHKPQL